MDSLAVKVVEHTIQIAFILSGEVWEITDEMRDKPPMWDLGVLSAFDLRLLYKRQPHIEIVGKRSCLCHKLGLEALRMSKLFLKADANLITRN